MAEIVRHFDGDDWQKEMLALLGKRYAIGEFLEVPSDDKGDLGMDAVGRDGIVYQFYAAQEPLSNDELKKKQKKKIYNDLLKLVNKPAEHERVLGNIRVKRWVLLVPRLKSKDVQVYANMRAECVRTANCSYIMDDFEALVATDAILAVERRQLVNSILSELRLDVPVPSTVHVDGWIKSKDGNELLETLMRKLQKIPNMTYPEALEEEVRRYILNFLRGQDLLNKLRNGHPQMWETVTREKRAFEDVLVVRSSVSGDSADRRLLGELDEYENRLGSRLQDDLGSENISQLVLEALADWLMRCPLDFRSSTNDRGENP